MTAPVVTSCSGCGRKYRFAVDRPRAAGDQERYRLAKDFGEANQIDLGSAYSVLEGVMTLEEAHALRKGLPPIGPGVKSQAPAASGLIVTGSRATLPVSAPTEIDKALLDVAAAARRDSGSETASRTAPAARVPSTPRPAAAETETSFDPGFAGAVRDGCLTPQQALENLKAHIAKLPDGLTADCSPIAEILKEIELEEKKGIEFTDQKMPEPQAVL